MGANREGVYRPNVGCEQILSVKPGITGLCQLAFANEGKILDSRDRTATYVERLLPQKVEIDSFYASNVYDGMWFDIGRREDYERAVEACHGARRNGRDGRAR